MLKALTWAEYIVMGMAPGYGIPSGSACNIPLWHGTKKGESTLTLYLDMFINICSPIKTLEIIHTATPWWNLSNKVLNKIHLIEVFSLSAENRTENRKEHHVVLKPRWGFQQKVWTSKTQAYPRGRKYCLASLSFFCFPWTLGHTESLTRIPLL